MVWPKLEEFNLRKKKQSKKTFDCKMVVTSELSAKTFQKCVNAICTV